MIARFRADLDRDGPVGRLGLAVSGGPDSLALLILAHAAEAGSFEVASVDHDLRPESAGEARFVADLCARLGVSHTTLAVRVDAGNRQRRAREARYAALVAWAQERGVDTLATAHHADDQAETLLMRLNRGSGLAGLACIRRKSRPFADGPALRRPLLDWRKWELEAIVAAAGIEPVRDPSNADTRFDRVRVREFLAEANWLDIDALARSATYLQEADELVEGLVEQAWSDSVSLDAGGLRYMPRHPAIVRRRIVERALGQLGATSVRGSAVAALEAALTRGGKGNLGGVIAKVVQGDWIFTLEPPRRVR